MKIFVSFIVLYLIYKVVSIRYKINKQKLIQKLQNENYAILYDGKEVSLQHLEEQLTFDSNANIQHFTTIDDKNKIYFVWNKANYIVNIKKYSDNTFSEEEKSYNGWNTPTPAQKKSIIWNYGGWGYSIMKLSAFLLFIFSILAGISVSKTSSAYFINILFFCVIFFILWLFTSSIEFWIFFFLRKIMFHHVVVCKECKFYSFSKSENKYMAIDKNGDIIYGKMCSDGLIHIHEDLIAFKIVNTNTIYFSQIKNK